MKWKQKAYRYVVSLIATDAVVAAIAIVFLRTRSVFGRQICSQSAQEPLFMIARPRANFRDRESPRRRSDLKAIISRSGRAPWRPLVKLRDLMTPIVIKLASGRRMEYQLSMIRAMATATAAFSFNARQFSSCSDDASRRRV
jgi:hypothetical protein